MPSGKHQRVTGLSRREALRFLGSASALPLVCPTLARLHDDAASPRGWQPRFLRPDQVETVAALSECIIPGAGLSEAAHEGMQAYIDGALERAEPGFQEAFADGLAWLEDYVSRSTGRSFVELGRDDRHRLLAAISDTSRAHEPTGYAFLTQIKQLTIEGYYRS